MARDSPNLVNVHECVLVSINYNFGNNQLHCDMLVSNLVPRHSWSLIWTPHAYGVLELHNVNIYCDGL